MTHYWQIHTHSPWYIHYVHLNLDKQVHIQLFTVITDHVFSVGELYKHALCISQRYLTTELIWVGPYLNDYKAFTTSLLVRVAPVIASSDKEALLWHQFWNIRARMLECISYLLGRVQISKCWLCWGELNLSWTELEWNTFPRLVSGCLCCSPILDSNVDNHRYKLRSNTTSFSS